MSGKLAELLFTDPVSCASLSKRAEVPAKLANETHLLVAQVLQSFKQNTSSERRIAALRC